MRFGLIAYRAIDIVGEDKPRHDDRTAWASLTAWRPQTATIEPTGVGQSRDGENRRREVDVMHRFLDSPGGNTARPMKEKRHAHFLLVDRLAMPVSTMFAKCLAVISGQNEQRVVAQPEGGQLLTQAPDFGVKRCQ